MYKYMIVMLEFRTFKKFTLDVISNNTTAKVIIKYFACALVCKPTHQNKRISLKHDKRLLKQ